jgi:hypothetical protein
MQAVAFGCRRHVTPTDVQAELPGLGVFDPLDGMRARHGLIPKARFNLAWHWCGQRDLGHTRKIFGVFYLLSQRANLAKRVSPGARDCGRRIPASGDSQLMSRKRPYW